MVRENAKLNAPIPVQSQEIRNHPPSVHVVRQEVPPQPQPQQYVVEQRVVNEERKFVHNMLL